MSVLITSTQSNSIITKKAKGMSYLMSASAVAITLAFAGAAQAQVLPAGCTPGTATAGDTIQCDGVINSQITTLVDDLTLNIGTSGAPAAVTGLNQGVLMISGNNINFNVVDSNTVVNGGLDGAFLSSSGGDINVNSEGTLVGDTRAGLVVLNSGAGGSANINVNNTYGNGTSPYIGEGIYVSNGYGTDSVNVTVTGTSSGSRNGVQISNSGTGSVTVDVNNAYGTYGDGIEVTNFGTDVSVSATGNVVGGTDGVNVRNYGTGSTVINVNNATGTAGYGVYALAFGTDLSITGTGDISGGTFGAVGLNVGTGSTSMNVNNAMGGTGDGAFLYGAGGTTDLSLTVTGDATGGRNGATAANFGTGATTVNINNATGVNYGLYAINGGGAADLNVTTTGDVVGTNFRGIVSIQNGTGAHTISANNVTGGTDGIYAYTGPTGTDLSVTATGDVVGAGNGIVANNQGMGATSVSANNVTGTAVDGIIVTGGANTTDLTVVATGDVVGGDEGVEVNHDGTGDVSVSVNNVTGGTAGGYGDAVFVDSYGSSVTVNATGDLTSGDDGVTVFNRGTGATTVNVNNITTSGMTANSSGMLLVNTGPTSTDMNVTATGSIIADDAGILAYNFGSGATNISVVDVTANNRGAIEVSTGTYSTDVSINASGPLTGGTYGVLVDHDGTGSTSINVADVTATAVGGDGINVDTAATTTDLTIVAGNVVGMDEGIEVNHNGTGALNITAANITSDLTGGFGDGILAFNNAGTDTNITVTGDIESGDDGVTAVHYGSGALNVSLNNVNATGASPNSTGVLAFNIGGTDVNVSATGTVNGDFGGVYVYNGGTGAATVNVNDVNSTSPYFDAIDVDTTGTSTDVTVNATGTVSGSGDGIDISHNGTGAVTVNTVDVNSTYGYGIDITSAGTDVSVTSTGAINSGGDGIEIFNNGTGATTVMANDVNSTYGWGIFAVGSGTDMSITSTGSVAGNGIFSSGITVGNFGTGTTSVTANDVTGGYFGIGAYALGAYSGDLNVTTTGAVTGGVDGIYAVNNGAGATTIIASGSVTGTYGAGISTSTTSGAVTNIILNSGANVSGGSGIAIQNDEGDSNVWVNDGATLSGEVRLGDGSDNMTISGAPDLSGVTVLDGGDDSDGADGFVDIFTLDGATGIVDLSILQNWEEVASVNSDVVLQNLVGSSLDVCGGSTTVGGTSNVEGVFGCVLDDTIVITNSSVVDGSIQGAGGADNISVLGDASVTGFIRGAGQGNDMSLFDDTGDMIRINTTGTVGAIDGGFGDDVIDLVAGTIMMDVDGANDNDTIRLTGATVVGNLLGGNGDDRIIMTDGSASNMWGEDGNDSLTVSGGALSGNVNGGAGDDTVSLSGGTLVDAFGEDGDDTLGLSGATLSGSLFGGNGNDSITMSGGSAVNAFGQAGNDGFFLDGAMMSGNIAGGSGDDQIILQSGSAVNAQGGDGDDKAELRGATLTGSVVMGAGDDLIEATAGSAVDLLGGTGNDTIMVDGTVAIGNFVSGGADDDLIWLLGGSAAKVDGGTGNDVLNVGGFDGTGAPVGAAISGGITAGDGDDTVNHVAGSFASLMGGAGTDTLNFNGIGFDLNNSGSAGDLISEFEVYNFNMGGFTLSGLHTGLSEVNFLMGTNTLAGTLESTLVNVAAGAGLDAASGSVVNGNLSNSGTMTIAGGMIGTTTVNGDFTQTSTGEILFDIVDSSSRDVLVVNGTANLGGTLSLSRMGFLNGVTTLIDANALNGTFDTENLGNPLGVGLLLSQVLEYDTANANVNMVGSVNDASTVAGLTPNQIAVGNNLINNFLNGNTNTGLTDVALSTGFLADVSALSSTLEELHPEEAIAGLQNYQNSQIMFVDRLVDMSSMSGCNPVMKSTDYCSEGRGKIWGSIQYAEAEQDGTASGVDFESDGFDITAGVTGLGKGPLTFGAAIGYASLDGEMSGAGIDEVETSILRAGVHAGADLNSNSSGILARFDGALTYADGEHDIDRDVIASAIGLSEMQSASSDVSGINGQLRLTLQGNDGSAWPIQPFLLISGDTVDQDGFSLGTGTTALTVSDAEGDRLSYGYGANFVHNTDSGMFRVTGTGMHHTGDTDAILSSSFNSLVGGSSSFTTIGEDVEDQYLLEIGYGHKLSSNWMIGLEGFGEFGDIEGYGGRLSVGGKF